MARTLTSTPRQDGFRMPGEFEPHVGCWMLWPERSDNWRSGAKLAQRAFAAVARATAEAEDVTVCVSRAQYAAAREMLPEQVRLIEMSSNDSWIRDCGPTFVVNAAGEVRGIDWKFRLFGDSCGSFSTNLIGGEVREHGGEDLEPQVLLIADKPDPIFLDISPASGGMNTNQGGRDESEAPEGEAGE